MKSIDEDREFTNEKGALYDLDRKDLQIACQNAFEVIGKNFKDYPRELVLAYIMINYLEELLYSDINCRYELEIVNILDTLKESAKKLIKYIK